LQLLRKNILTNQKPVIEGPLGQPPFEKPSIARGVTNFVLLKFGNLPANVSFLFDLIKYIFTLNLFAGMAD